MTRGYGARELVARNVKRIRVESKLTQADVAKKVGKTRQWVSKVECEQVAIDVDAIDCLASALEVNSCELLVEPTMEDLISVAAHTGCIGVWMFK